MFKSFKYAFNGIFDAIKSERNMKIHCLAVLLVTAAGLYFKITAQQWIDCLLCFGLVISLEMVNTAIEKLADRVTRVNDDVIRFVKDVAAGAVLVGAIVAAIIGLIIFIPYIL